MEEKENNYISMNEAKSAIILDIRDLNFCYYNTLLNIEIIFNLVIKILIYLNAYLAILSIAYFAGFDKRLEFSVYLFALALGILFNVLKYNKDYKEYLDKKLEEDKMRLALDYFSKTKESTEEVWIKNKIFEEEIMPIIS